MDHSLEADEDPEMGSEPSSLSESILELSQDNSLPMSICSETEPVDNEDVLLVPTESTSLGRFDPQSMPHSGPRACYITGRPQDACSVEVYRVQAV